MRRNMSNNISTTIDGKSQHAADSDVPADRVNVARTSKAEQDVEDALALARWADDGGPTGPEK